MPLIFICYRREDTAPYTGRLYDDLVDYFGSDHLFRDIYTLELGDNFVEAIKKAIGSCDALIVLIGEKWLNCADEKGRRRLDNPEDYLRLEIATALDRDILVIPVLVQGATMPRPQDLPDTLVKLTQRHALEITDSHWKEDVNRLIETL